MWTDYREMAKDAKAPVGLVTNFLTLPRSNASCELIKLRQNCTTELLEIITHENHEMNDY